LALVRVVRNAQRLVDGIRWLAPVHRWTTAVTVLFFAGLLAWLIAIGLGLTSARQAPGEVVLAAYEAAQERRADDFGELLDRRGRAEFARLSPTEIEALFDRLTFDGTTTTFTFLGLRNYGKSAVAGVLQETTTREAHVRVEVLLQEGRFWRIEWPIGEAEWVESVLRFDPYYIPPSGLVTPTPGPAS